MNVEYFNTGAWRKTSVLPPGPCLGTSGDTTAPKEGGGFSTIRTKMARSSMHLCTAPAHYWRGGGHHGSANTRSPRQGKAWSLLTRAWAAVVGVRLAARLSVGVH